MGPRPSTDFSSTTILPLNKQIETIAAIQFGVLVDERYCFCLSKFSLRICNSWQRHSSYANSNSPGPSCRCTSIAAPIIRCVMSLSNTKKGIYHRGHREHREEEELGDGDFFVGAEDFAHGVADFTERGVGFYGVEDVRHQIVAALRRFAQCAQATRDFVARSLGAQFAQALGLTVRNSLIDLQSVQRVLFRHEVIHADNNLLLLVDLDLIAV